MKKGLFSYENRIVALMALTFGCLFFDRLALNFLMPYVAKDLQLNNTQIGLLAPYKKLLEHIGFKPLRWWYYD